MIYGKVYCIVEGRGEQKAGPTLIKKVMRYFHQTYIAEMEDGHFLPRGQIIHNVRELHKAISFGSKKIQKYGTGRIVILLDSDDDCVEDLYAKIQKNVDQYKCEYPIHIVIFEKEYESMFILKQESIKAHIRVRENPEFSETPCTIRDAKGWFERKILVPEDSYNPTIDQNEFTKILDAEVILSTLTCGKFLKELQQ